jgi:hypothetical protein
MKKIITFIIIIITMCFTGCNYSDSETVNDIQEKRTFIITDEDTGVQYIVYREKYGYAGMGGITPRYNSDGTLHTVNDKEGG